MALTEQLLKAGYLPGKGRQTQPHASQSKLIKEKLGASLGPKAAKRLAAVYSRLYQRRLDADYKKTVSIDRRIAVDSIRDAASVLRRFKVGES